MRIYRNSLAVVIGALGLAGGNARAIITYNDGITPLRLKTAPDGAFAGSGWDSEGLFSVSLALPISENYIVTAKHLNIGASNTYTLNNINYLTDQRFDDPNSDLAVYHLSTPVPSSLVKPIYTANTEVGKTMAVFGRGLPPGAVVTSVGTAGWKFGIEDDPTLPKSWGSNVVTSTLDNSGASSATGGFLYFKFNSNALATEGTLAFGDSGGGVFISDGGVWKLAGINLGIEGPFSTTLNGPTFDAAIFNGTGLFIGDPASTPLPPGYSAGATATRLSTNMSFLNQFIPEPAIGLPIFAAWGLLMRRQRRRV